MSIDPLNTKTTNYDAMDLELGFTKLSSTGAVNVWGYQGPNQGDLTSQINLKVVRDDTAKTTTYEYAIPKTLVPNLSTATGKHYGLNFCLNDADSTGSRINTVQFTNDHHERYHLCRFSRHFTQQYRHQYRCL